MVIKCLPYCAISVVLFVSNKRPVVRKTNVLLVEEKSFRMVSLSSVSKGNGLTCDQQYSASQEEKSNKR